MFLSKALRIQAEAALREATNKNALIEIAGTAMSVCPREMESDFPKHSWYGSIDFEQRGYLVISIERKK